MKRITATFLINVTSEFDDNSADDELLRDCLENDIDCMGGYEINSIEILHT